MKRSIYQSGPCGCSNVSLSKLIDEQVFDRAADTVNLSKGRRPVRTNVGRYVATKAPSLARKLAAVLRRQASQIRRLVLEIYSVEKLSKAEDLTDAQKKELVASIIAQLNSEDLGTDLSDALDSPMTDAFKRAAAVGLAQAGFNAEDRSIVEQVDLKAASYAAERSGELVTDLADTTLEDLRDLIRRGVEDGMSTNELGDAIDDLGAFGDARAEMIARTELASAHVQGNVEGWRQTGEVEKKESILGDLHAIDDVCDDCADAGEVDLEDDFTPGYDFPPYHPNCICDVKPVLIADD